MNNEIDPIVEQVTATQLQRFKETVESYSLEPMRVEKIKGTLYAYGSELAMLRLIHRYLHTVARGKARGGYSHSLETHYFSIDLSY